MKVWLEISNNMTTLTADANSHRLHKLLRFLELYGVILALLTLIKRNVTIAGILLLPILVVLLVMYICGKNHD